MAAAQHAGAERRNPGAALKPAALRPAFPAGQVLGGLAVFAALAALFRFTDLDQGIARLFYAGAAPWPGRTWAWSEALYHGGPWAADLCGALGALAFGLSFAFPGLRRWRGPGLYLALLLLLGPGLLCNTLAKGLAGRPRPAETLGFGGPWEFHAPFQFGVPGRGQSFLSGHASTAWYFLGLWFLPALRRSRGRILAAALAFGLAMGLARVSQGAHWASDVLLPAPLLWSLAAALSPLIHAQPKASLFARPGFWLALGGTLLGLLSLSRVRYEERHFSGPDPAPQEGATWRPLPPPPGPAAPKEVDVEADFTFGDLDVDFAAAPPSPGAWPLGLDETFQGQGLPPAFEAVDALPLPADGPLRAGPDALGALFVQRAHGLWLVADEEARLKLPADLDLDARLRVADGTLTIGAFPAGRRVLLERLPEGARAPDGFTPFGGHSWLKPGKPPLITLDLDAPDLRFAPGAP